MSESVEKSGEKPASSPSLNGNDHDQSNKHLPTDLADRRKHALAEIDNAKFSWFHAKVALIAGVGFFTDASVFFLSLLTNQSLIQSIQLPPSFLQL